MTYVYARRAPSPHAAALGPIQEVEDDYELVLGVPRLDGWPSDAHFEMDPDFGLRLDDVVQGSDALLIVSDALRRFLEAEGVPDVEMLPVTILDHKGRPVPTPYAVVHHVRHPDALDAEASGVTVNPIDPDYVMAVERLVIRPEAVPPEARTFRLARYPFPVLFEAGLAERIEAEGFTGIAFAPLDAFDRYALL